MEIIREKEGKVTLQKDNFRVTKDIAVLIKEPVKRYQEMFNSEEIKSLQAFILTEQKEADIMEAEKAFLDAQTEADTAKGKSKPATAKGKSKPATAKGKSKPAKGKSKPAKGKGKPPETKVDPFRLENLTGQETDLKGLNRIDFETRQVKLLNRLEGKIADWGVKAGEEYCRVLDMLNGDWAKFRRWIKNVNGLTVRDPEIVKTRIEIYIFSRQLAGKNKRFFDLLPLVSQEFIVNRSKAHKFYVRRLWNSLNKRFGAKLAEHKGAEKDPAKYAKLVADIRRVIREEVQESGEDKKKAKKVRSRKSNPEPDNEVKLNKAIPSDLTTAIAFFVQQIGIITTPDKAEKGLQIDMVETDIASMEQSLNTWSVIQEEIEAKIDDLKISMAKKRRNAA